MASLRSNFVNAIFHGGKTTEPENNKSTDNKEVKGVKVLPDNEVVGIVDNSLVDKAKGGLSTAWDWAVSLVDNSVVGAKQNIDNELMGLQKNGQAVSKEGKNIYVQQLNEYNNLMNKGQNRTGQDFARLVQLQNELDKYTVSDEQKWWIGRFLPDTRRNSFFLDDDGKQVAVDKESILKNLGDRVKPMFGISGGEDNSGIRMMTEEEYEKEKKTYTLDTDIQNEIIKQAEKGVKDFYIANRNPGGRRSTLDEVAGDISAVLNDRSFASTLESYKEAYARFKDKDPAIAEVYKDASINMVGLAYHLLSTNRLEEDSYAEYVREHGNPFIIDLESIPKDKLTSYGIQAISNTKIGRLTLTDLLLDGFVSTDGYATTNLLIRASQLIDDAEEGTWGSFGKSLWHGAEYIEALAQGYLSSGLGLLKGGSELASKYLAGGEINDGDLQSYLIGWQNSNLYRVKANHQDAWSNLDYAGSNFVGFVNDYGSTLDDIVLGYAEAKIDIPIKLASFKNIAKFVDKANKVEGVIEDTSKTASKVAGAVEKTSKAVEQGEKMISDGEKISDIAKGKSVFTRVKEGAKEAWDGIGNRVKNKIDNTREGIDGFSKLGKGDKALLLGENAVRWLAEEALQSALYQGMTPYDYESSDFVMDMFGAMFSGFMRATGFVNKLGLMNLQAKDNIWAILGAREILKLSDSKVEEMVRTVPSQELINFGKAVQEIFKPIADEASVISRSKVKSAAQKLSEASRDIVNNQYKAMVGKADDMLKQKLFRSTNSEYSGMVKQKRYKKADGTWGKKLERNKPNNMSNKSWDSKVSKARQKAYSPGGLDNANTTKGRINQINNIKKYVKDHLAEIVAKGRGMKFVERDSSAGKWKFKDSVTKSQIRELYKAHVDRRLTRLGLNRKRVLSKSKNRFARGLFGVQDEVNGLFDGMRIIGPMEQKIRMFINDQIYGKELTKLGYRRALVAYGESVARCFDYWLKEAYPGKTFDKMTTEEIAAALTEFGRVYDAKYFADYMNTQHLSNMGDPFSTSSEYLANMTYDKACSINEDLKYLGADLFHEIAGDPTLSVVEKEMKLAGYKWTGAIEGTAERKGAHIFGVDIITTEKNIGRKIFNDNYEEKVTFGSKGTMYLRVRNEDGATMIEKHRKQNSIKSFNREQQDVIECTYRRETNTTRDGNVVYSVYQGDEKVATIYTSADVDLGSLEKPYKPQDIYPKGRMMTVQLEGKLAGNGSSIDFEVVKDSDGDVRVFRDDIDLTVKADRVIEMEDIGEKPEDKRITTLKQWNGFAVFVREGGKSYNEFIKLIPGYTDRVPRKYFELVAGDKNLGIVDKQNLLMAMMTNRAVSETRTGIRFDLSKDKTFKRPAYTQMYPIFEDGKLVEWGKRQVKGDAEYLMAGTGDGVVIIEKDPGAKAEAYFYELTDKPGIYNIYKEGPEATSRKPVGVISVTSEKMVAYFKQGTRRTYVKGSVEFPDSKDYKYINRELSERYGTPVKEVAVPGGDEMYNEVYRALYGRDIPDAIYHRLRSTPNMTPQRYLNNEISRLKDNRFGRYIKITKGNWKETAEQLNSAKYRIAMAENFIHMFEDTKLTDKEIVSTIDRIISNRIANNNSNVLTKGEREIADILYGEGKYTFSDSELINIYGYSMFGIEPEKITNNKIKRLRARRDNILMALYKDPKIIDLDDGIKDLLVQRARKGLGLQMSEEELLQDILDNPLQYNKILQGLTKTIVEAENAADNTNDIKRLGQVNKRLNELSRVIGDTPMSKKVGPNTKKIKKVISEYQSSEVDNLIEQAQQEIIQASNEGDELRRNAAYSKYGELTEYKIRSQEEIAYEDSKSLGDLTPEQFNFLAQRKVTGSDGQIIREAPMSYQEIDTRIKAISNKVPSKRIIEVQPDGTVSTRGFTEQEGIKYKQQIEQSAQKIVNHNANAAYVRELHAIVVDPKRMMSSTLGHEWFHEAIDLMSDSKRTPGKIEELFSNVYRKHGDLIDEFARQKGYDEVYAETMADSFDAYKKQITEEWLAERFGEYVNNRLSEELQLDSDLMRFFKELWDRIKTMFSDTDALELFEDIYEGRINYDDITIDIGPNNVTSPKFSLISDEARTFFDTYNPDTSNIKFGDSFNTDTITALKSLGLYDKDLKVGTTRGLSGRGSFLSSIKTDFEDGTRASFDDLFESITLSSANVKGDNLLNYIYGGEFLTDFGKIDNEVLMELQSKGVISRGGNGFTVTFKTQPFYPESQTVSPVNRKYSFDIMLGNKTVLTFDEGNLFSKAEQANLPLAMPGNERYKMVVNRIVTRLNDSDATKLSRTSLNNNITAEIQKYSENNNALVDVLSIPQDVLKKMQDSLENAIRKGYDQNVHPDLSGVGAFEQYAAREAFVIYLFNQYIPHAEGSNALKTILFDRKTELTLNLLRRIEVEGNKNVTWKVTPKDKKMRTLKIYIDMGDAKPREIGWHLMEGGKWVDMLENAGFDLTNHEGDVGRANLWKQSILSISKKDYADMLKNNTTISSKGQETAVFGQNMRDKLEKSRPYLFDNLTLSFQNGEPRFYLGYKENPIVIDGSRGVVIQKDMRYGDLLNALDNKEWVASSSKITNEFSMRFGDFGNLSLLGRKAPTDFNRVPFENAVVGNSDVFSETSNAILYGHVYLELRKLDQKYGGVFDNVTQAPEEFWQELRRLMGTETIFNMEDIDRYRQTGELTHIDDGGEHDFLNESDIDRIRNPKWDRAPGRAGWTDRLERLMNTRNRINAKNKILEGGSNAIQEIVDVMFEGRIAGTDSGQLRAPVRLFNIIADMLDFQGRSDEVAYMSNQYPYLRVLGDSGIIEEPYGVYDKQGFIDIDKTIDKFKNSDWFKNHYAKHPEYEGQDIDGIIRRYIELMYPGQYRYLELWTPVFRMNDFYGVVVPRKQYLRKGEVGADEMIGGLISGLRKNGYIPHVIKTTDNINFEQYKELLQDKKNFLIIDHEEGSDETLTKNIRNVSFQIDNKGLSEDVLKLAHGLGLDTPINLVSVGRHLDNVRYMNDIHKKYNINIKNASQKTKNELDKLKGDRNVRSQQTWNNVKRRLTNKEYNDLTREREEIRNRIAQMSNRWQSFQQTPVYKQADRIRRLLEENQNAYKAVRDVDETVVIKAEMDGYRPAGELNEALEDTKSVNPPFGKLANIDTSGIKNENMLDGLSNFDEYKLRNEESGMFSDELREITKHSNSYVIYPVKDGDVFNEDLFNKVIGEDYFAIWAEDSKTLNDWKSNLNIYDSYHQVVYERPKENIIYYSNNVDIDPDELAIAEAIYGSTNILSDVCKI